MLLSTPKQPQCTSIKALMVSIDGIWGILVGSWGVLLEHLRNIWWVYLMV